MADEIPVVLIEEVASIIAGIFVRANITSAEIDRLISVSDRLATLKQHEQDVIDGKV